MEILHSVGRLLWGIAQLALAFWILPAFCMLVVEGIGRVLADRRQT